MRFFKQNRTIPKPVNCYAIKPALTKGWVRIKNSDLSFANEKSGMGSVSCFWVCVDSCVDSLVFVYVFVLYCAYHFVCLISVRLFGGLVFMMSEFVLRRNDISTRVDLCKGCDLVSHEFLSSLLRCLDDSGDEIEKLWGLLVDLIRSCVDDFDQLRRELSLVPVDFVYKKYVRYNPLASPQRMASYGLERGDRRFGIGSQSCPRSVLPVAESELSEGDVVWCLYPVTLAGQVRRRPVKVWSSEDPLVDHLFAWTEADRTSARCVREIENYDVLWKFSVDSDPSSDTRPSERVPSYEMSPRDRIYTYIRDHSPVSTGEIMRQAFAGRSRVYVILTELVRDDKIRKVYTGVYEVI